MRRRRMLCRVSGRSGGSDAVHGTRGVGLLAKRRNRLLGGLPRPVRGACRGRIQSLRHVSECGCLPRLRTDPRSAGGAMDWMSPMDASFLHIEGPTNPMHIGGVSIFEGPAPPFERLEEMVAGKLARAALPAEGALRPARPRPSGVGRRSRTSTSPTTCATPLCRLRVATTASPHGRPHLRPAARPHKPLWEIWMIERLDESRWALLSKVHHCMVDGVSATDLMAVMFGGDSPRDAADRVAARHRSRAAPSSSCDDHPSHPRPVRAAASVRAAAPGAPRVAPQATRLFAE